jgi:hypothetical protein
MLLMLADFDLREFGFSDHSRYILVPSGHPAIMELEQDQARPVGAVQEQGWFYLFRVQDWNRVATDQLASASGNQFRPAKADR